MIRSWKWAAKMKSLILVILFLFSAVLLKAQDRDFEIKVISKKYQNVRGKLQKVSPEGIAIADYKGNYLIFRAAEIVKLKVRRRGLTIGEATGTGAIVGLGIGAGIWSLDEQGESAEEMLKLTTVLTASGAVLGAITGVVVETANRKLTLSIEGNEEKYLQNYKKLMPYINLIRVEPF